MSFWSILSAIPGTLAKVGTAVISVGKIALPILRAFRPAFKEIDDAFIFVEEKISEGGEVADDFLDDNIDTIRATGAAFGKVEAIGTNGVELCDMLDRFSQSETPDTITEDELIAIAHKLDEFREIINSADGVFDEAIKGLESMA